MSFAFGVVLFALILAISISAHEFGHLLTAKMFGMKARRYFIGFGPKIWSFRRGETEYGLKAIPAGGFVDIAGMSHVEVLDEDDEPRAFWRFAAWKRAIVMAAGSATHFVLALIILYFLAAISGLPTVEAANAPTPAVVAEVPDCVQQINNDGSAQPCTSKDPPSPAKQAGLQVGDKITMLNGQPLANWDDMVKYVRAHPNTTLTLTIQRGNQTLTRTMTTVSASRPAVDGEKADKNGRATVGVLAASAQPPSGLQSYNPVTAVGGTFTFTGSLFKSTFAAIGQFPSKIPKLLDALAGKPRDADTPVSVIGASKLGGQAVEAHQWQVFFLLLAGFNLFIGVFNLLPLLPLDGGHIAVLAFEKLRSVIAVRRGREDPGAVDQAKLAPIMLTVIFLVGGISLLTMYADVVNPIANPFQ